MKPVIVLSRCLELDACRYDGRRKKSPFVRRLRKHVRFVPVCPEVEIGLGVPRDPIHINKSRRLVQPSTGRDLTAKMNRFSMRFLKSLGEVDGFILKARSPSCGVRDVGRQPGLFGRAVRERFPDLPIETEARLLNPKVRKEFLKKIFARSGTRIPPGLA